LSSTPLIADIARGSSVDGPGLRTVVFIKGCPLRCVWCHNPECMLAHAELALDIDRCGGCGRCVDCCPKGALSVSESGVVIDRSRCDHCGLCTEVCDRLDNDCNGTIDDMCTCRVDEPRPCYTGPSETRGVGACRGGMRTCANGNYTRCTGEVKPSLELCNGVDDDCDGTVDDLCVGMGGGTAQPGDGGAGGGSAGGGSAGGGSAGGEAMTAGGAAGGGATEMPKGCGCSGVEGGVSLLALGLMLLRRRSR